jgi:type I restriction enzyme S subunit
MSGVRTVLLRDICNFEKGSTGLMKAEPGEYPLVTTGAERRTCQTYQFDTKAVCIPLVSSTGHGHASLNNVHYQEGKFALGTIIVALTAKNEEELDVHFLHLYLSQLKDVILVPLMRGAANVSLSISAIRSIEIPLPSIKRQKEIVKKFKSIVVEEKELINELIHQQNLLDEFRKRIFQDAIEGKLTRYWRKKNKDIEPVSNLIARINKEKEQLTRDKKIRKQKCLPLISEKEKPFELPESWEWCRLCSLGFFAGGGTPSKAKSEYWNGDIPWISPKDMKSATVNNSELKITLDGVQNSSANIIPPNSILIVGRSGILKRTVPVSVNSVECTVNQDIKVILPYIQGLELYIQRVLWGMESFILDNLVKYGMTVHSLKYDEFAMQPVPVPPIEEQKAIVVKIEKMQSICNRLQTNINNNKTHAEKLMKVVLTEEFFRE